MTPPARNDETGTARRRFDWRNPLLALLAPVVFFGGLELLLALFAVEPRRYPHDPYVGFSSYLPLFVEQTADDGRRERVTAQNKLRLFNAQRFAADKPAGAFRIFCVGGSTTYGRPYDDPTSFCGWLRELLPEVAPGRRWEVINAGGISYASYRTALLMEELIGYQPDLFLVYSGHNEFLEKRTYGRLVATPRPVRGLAARASRTRVWAVLETLLGGLRAAREAPAANAGDGGPTAEATKLDSEVRTLLDASVGPDAFQRDDLQRERALQHYRFNLARMAEIARSAGAEILFVTPAANLRHSSPFKSEPGEAIDASAAAHVAERLETAAAAVAAGDGAGALARLDEALALDDRYAETHFLRGRALDLTQHWPDAEAAYERARDEDVCPLRALGPAAGIVRRVAAEHRALLVDFAATARRRAPQGIPGAETFFDHVHPRIEVHRELALEILAALRAAGLLGRAAWDETTVARATRRVEGRLDRTAHGRALLNLSKVLGWAGKLEEAGRLAEQAIELAPELPEAHYQAGLCAQLTGHAEDAIGYYRTALELAPGVATTHGNLAAALAETGQTLTAIYHYRRAIALLGPGDSSYKAGLIEALVALGATP